jgi:hypothetical protein
LRIKVQGQSGQVVHEIPISKITRANWIGGLVQIVECLLCKCEAEFKPQSHQKKREEEEERRRRKKRMRVREEKRERERERMTISRVQYNPIYLRGGDQEDHSSRPAQAESSRDPISTKKLGMVVHTCYPNYSGSVNR